MELKSSFSLLLFVGLFRSAAPYSYFRDGIPNGYNVSHPCDNTLTWNGVGHENSGGGGVRNPFGLAFYNNQLTWTEALCRADSDGDGKTNGEELGDPDCTWSIGQTPTQSPAPSHPGVCEPIDSAECRMKNTFLDCGKTGFNCPATKEPGVFEHRVGFAQGTQVPGQETTYMCQGMNLPTEKDYHLIAAKGDIDNIAVAHHIIVYGCSDDAELTTEQISQPFPCFMGNARGCNDMIAIWGFGFESGMCYHEDAGFKIGVTGYKQAIFEIHWNNPELRTDYTDSSGMIFYLTPNLRQNDAGVFMIGQSYLEIPPMERLYEAKGHCSGDCTNQIFSGPVNIFGVLNHMHNLGIAALSTMTNAYNEVTELARDDAYDYNTPVYYSYDRPFIFNPGDTLNLTCHFNSLSRTTTTMSGEETADEMCFAFLMYYPKANANARQCTSFGPYDRCTWRADSVIDGCRPEYRNPARAEFLAFAGRLYSVCQPAYCLKECIPVAREFHNNPCNQGFFRTMGRVYLSQDTNQVTKAQAIEYYSRADSCLMEVARSEGKCEGGAGGLTSGASLSSGSAIFILFFLLLQTVLP